MTTEAPASLKSRRSADIQKPQREHWITDEVVKLPFANIEGIRSILALSDRINESFLARKRTREELNALLPQASGIAQVHIESVQRLQHDSDSKFWQAARSVGRADIAEGLYHLGQYKIIMPENYTARYASRSTHDSAESAQREVNRTIVDAIKREIIRDVKGFEENPYLSLLRLHEIGALRVNFGFIDNTQVLIADFMLKYDGEHPYEMGCVALGKDGDQRVGYVHSFDTQHEEARPIDMQRTVVRLK